MRHASVLLVLLLGLGIVSPAAGQDPSTRRGSAIIGRWDIVVRTPDGEYPSWLEVERSGSRTLVGRFVGRSGSSRPISRVEFEDGRVRWVIPPQFEQRKDDLRFEGRLEGDTLSGETSDDKGRQVTWAARRAPALKRTNPPAWGEAIELFNGKDLAGWTFQLPGRRNGWVVREGLLVNATPGNNLMTEQRFTDFKVHVEYRYPKGSNSGLYLRGRYEVQIEDDHSREPNSHGSGGVYGFLTPCLNMARAPGEWQTLDVTLVGRMVTVELNGERVIDRQTIPGITGGAIDSDEGVPGPILLQGDHGPIEFRKVTLTPAR
jgi:hypothetical protein